MTPDYDEWFSCCVTQPGLFITFYFSHKVVDLHTAYTVFISSTLVQSQGAAYGSWSWEVLGEFLFSSNSSCRGSSEWEEEVIQTYKYDGALRFFVNLRTCV